MALEDRVIVTEEYFKGLYKKKRSISFLEENDLLPLTVQSLTTDKGRALLKLATWIYVSGEIRKKDFVPRISKSEKLLRQIANSFENLGLNLRFERTYRGGGHLLPTKKGGMIGRLIYAMGVPKPPLSTQAIMKKPHYDYGLPHYFRDILDSHPSNQEQEYNKKALIDILLKILYTDRVKTSKIPKKGIYLQLNSHSSEKKARSYGLAVVSYLNDVFKLRNYKSLFFNEQVKADYDADIGLYKCELKIKDKQFAYITPYIANRVINGNI